MASDRLILRKGPGLTTYDPFDAMRPAMNEIVDKILLDQPAGLEARERVANYIGLLASTGKTNGELFRYGRAYLKEILEPDPRYTGC